MVMIILTALLLALFGCRSAPTPGETTPEGQALPLDQDQEIGPAAGDGPGSPPREGDDQENLIRLSDGNPQPVLGEVLRTVEGAPLTAEEIEQILELLPALEPAETDQKEFNLPEEILPPPRPGETVDQAFPAQDDQIPPGEADYGPVEVLRYAPEGEVEIAPFISVTFDQPMVPLDTVEALEDELVPVVVEPSLEGSWRWLGTRTLQFESDSELYDRLPMATSYRVTVPAGVRSQAGEVLEETVEFTFSTPPPTVEQVYPDHSPQPLHPVIFVSFDQRINPEQVLNTLEVRAGGELYPARMAGEEEIDADERVQQLVEGAEESRWLAVRTEDQLPANTTVQITIGPGTPSAEGPLTTAEAQTFSFSTYPPLSIEEHGCSYSDEPCRPFQPLFIRFNNPLDQEAYQEDLLTIEPELPGASVTMYGDTLQIRGATAGSTTYTVRVSGKLQDAFGQELGRDQSLKFRVGKAEPVLFGPGQILVTVDPASVRPSLNLYTVNYPRLDVQVYRVEPADWPAFNQYLRDYQRNEGSPRPPGTLVRDESLKIEGQADQLTEIRIDLSEELEGSSGHFVVVAKPPRGLFQKDRYWEIIQTWVQVTQIGMDALVDSQEMVVWTTALENGQPLEGITIQDQEGKALAESDASGAARFEIPGQGLSYLVGRQGEDIVLLPPSLSYWYENRWERRENADELRWFVFDDRKMYRPGEQVHVKGWLRRIEREEGGGIGPVGEGLTEVDYQIYGPQGNQIQTGTAAVNAWGGFDLAFSLPENINLGYANIGFEARGSLAGVGGRAYNHQFQVQEFRRPEFEVTARNESTGPYFVSEHAVVAVEAGYYAGGPLPNADVNWRVNASPTNYQPPNWPDFTFGFWTPWWYFAEWYGGGSQPGQQWNFSGRTDSTGNHYLRLDFESLKEPRPLTVSAEGTVFDVNRQAWAGRTDLLVHPSELYVGLRTQRYFVQQGDPLEVELIAVDLDGGAVSGREILVTASRLEWKYQDGSWQEVEVDPQTCRVTSEDEPVSCTFQTTAGGKVQIQAVVEDDSGRPNQSRLTRWVSGGDRPPSRKLEQESLTLIPNQETYQPGDTAEILVQAPFESGELLLTVSRDGILYSEEISFQDGSATLQVPIRSEHIPNLHVQVDAVGSAPRLDDQGEPLLDAPERPAFAVGRLNLDIPPLERTLEVSAEIEDQELEPGGQTSLDLEVLDAAGQPVTDAELAVVVVDEAVLALTGYQLTDPLSVFYSQRPSGFSTFYTRSSVRLASLEDLLESPGNLPQATLAVEKSAAEGEDMLEAPMEEAEADAVGRGGGGQEPSAITVRKDFNPLAVFAPEVRTDSRGQARVQVDLPDNLTRYRVMVVAVDQGGKLYGSAEANLTARLPLMVRPSAPRFLNFGDQFEFPVVLQNQTGEDLETEVILRASNLELSENIGVRVTVPARDRIEVRFPAATELSGTMRYQVAAVSGAYTDAALGELPVYTPATTEAFATYGTLDQGAVAQPVASPEDVYPQYGGLEITTSSTALQALTDAVLYLVSYPYECTEQLASRVLGIAALRDVLTAFEADGLPEPAEMEAAVARDLEQLSRLQNPDGGFPYWRRGQDSIPFNTIHTAHALVTAEQKGFAVPEGMQEQILPYLREIENHYPSWYSDSTRHTLSAYALYVRDLMGDSDPAKASALLDQAGLEELSLDALGWIWEVLSGTSGYEDDLEAVRRRVGNRVVETAGAANFTTRITDQNYLLLSSDRRTDAVLLNVLMTDQPDSDLIPKLVQGLLAHRKKGRWGNTQENVFVLLALDRYFQLYESQTPEFVARIWLGDTYAGEHAYSGRTTERINTEIPMAFLVSEAGPQDLVISKEGQGRLYYRLGLKYAPDDLELEPLERGFVVLREYQAVDAPEDVTRDEDGTWRIKAGARVRVKLTMVADSRRYHVALVDPLPAGLEIINPALAVSGSVPEDPDQNGDSFRWWWWGPWYEHQNMRDERAEAFSSLLWDGVYEYTYVARATTPGTFVVPPTKAEEMYSPEVFGRSGTDLVVVE
jgi:hypothetical protein